ncbi:MAG: hypothetical protein MUF54_10925 [Polyangiaceae bacterium]|nr:hypothetical protein [Polyangiaceae bacterium]
MPIDREKVLQAAQKHVEKKRFDRAIVEFQKIVQEDPNDARILLKIGDLQARMDAFEAAIGTYERVAKHYATQGFSVKAIAVYKQIREIVRKHVPQLADQYGHIIPKMAQLYQDLGLTGDALSAYDEYATHLQRCGREREATDIFRKIVEINGNNPLARLRLAEALLRHEGIEQALEQFSLASDILVGMGRRDDALKVLERMLYQKQEPALARRAAELYLDRSQPDDGMLALAKLQICFQADHRDLDTLGLLARAFVAIGQAPKAIEVRKEYVRIAREKGKLDLARRSLRELLDEVPNDEVVQNLAKSLFAAARASSSPASADDGAQLAAQHRTARRPFADDPDVEVSVASVDIGTDGDLGLGTDEDFDDTQLIDGPYRARTEPVSGPTSVRHVEVGDHVSAVEEAPPPDAHEAAAHLHEVLASAEAFRSHRLYAKAIETLRMGLEVDPTAFELRVMLKDVLAEAGDHVGANDELANIAMLYFDAQEFDTAAQLFAEVLTINSAHTRAREVLIAMGYEIPELPNQAPEASAMPAGSRTPRAAFPSYEERFAASYDSSEPLPSYDLEEISPSFAMSPVPVPGSRAAYASLLTTDDPFSPADGRASSGEPFDFSSRLEQPLPCFPLTEDRRLPDELLELRASGDDRMTQDSRAPLSSAAPCDRLAESAGYHALPQVPSPVPEAPAEAAPVPLASTRAFRGGDSLEDALEESDFFASRGLFDDALAILEEQGQRFPAHPLLIERMREVREAMEAAAGSGEPVVPQSQTPGAADGALDDRAFDIAASLDALDSSSPGADGPMPSSNFGTTIDVEEVFAKFKEGIRQQVSESDSQTHYDLGVAYKEMGLLDDSIVEFEMASRDPSRACVCWSMIGIVHVEQGSLDAATEAFIRGLHAEVKSREQEMALCYELGGVYELRGNPQEALYYFEKVMRRDPDFRDAFAHVRRLQQVVIKATRPLRAAVGEDEFDRAFDDLFAGSKFH